MTNFYNNKLSGHHFTQGRKWINTLLSIPWEGNQPYFYARHLHTALSNKAIIVNLSVIF